MTMTGTATCKNSNVIQISNPIRKMNTVHEPTTYREITRREPAVA